MTKIDELFLSFTKTPALKKTHLQLAQDTSLQAPHNWVLHVAKNSYKFGRERRILPISTEEILRLSARLCEHYSNTSVS